MIIHVPNILTVMRMLLVPVFIYLLFWGGDHRYLLALVIFITAGVTDIVDGYLARKLKIESTFGKLLDPLAVKLLVLSALVSFVTMGLIYAWMVALIVLRDVVVTTIRFLLERSATPMATSNVAKGKTAVQIAIVILILSYLSMQSYQVEWVTDLIDRSRIIPVAMVITMLFTVYTGFDYLVVNRAGLRALARPNSE